MPRSRKRPPTYSLGTRTIAASFRAMSSPRRYNRSQVAGKASGSSSKVRSWIVTTSDCPSRIGGIVAGFVACTTRHLSSACGNFGRRATDQPR